MSQLELSDELIKELQNVVVKYDERASDMGIAVQYYAAVIGYVLGQQNFPVEEKKEFLNQLFGFSMHVLEDVVKPQQAPPQSQEAFGVWKPGDK
jgi:hypothetical protein